VRPLKTSNQQRDFATFLAEIKDCDLWIELRLAFLERELHRLAADPIARHYLDYAWSHYARFLSSRAPEEPFKAWQAIVVSCQWLSQLDGARKLTGPWKTI
jgi:hypothetical protein